MNHNTEEYDVLWRPSAQQSEQSQLAKLADYLGISRDFASLHQFSIKQPLAFWNACFDQLGIVHNGNRSEVFRFPNPTDHHSPRAEWFPGIKLNFAQNLLKNYLAGSEASNAVQSNDELLIFRGESQIRRSVSASEVTRQSQTLARILKELSVVPGSRCAAIAVNGPEAIVSMLATTQCGAVWSSCSPDFGVSGILDRFEQIAPTVLFVSPRYLWKGSWIDCREKIAAVVAALPAIKAVVVLPYEQADVKSADLPGVTVPVLSWSQATSGAQLTEYEQVDFNAPLYIMFSSGTTGKPKCIIHSVGGTLLEHLKELTLHTDLRSDERLLYHTTCGWMMWNWMVSALAPGVSLVLYDGSPLERKSKLLFDIVEEEGVHVFGTSAKFIALAEKDGVTMRGKALPHLRAILSTGSPLLPESFDFIYREIKSDVCLSSIAGGTDIIGCFTLGNPCSAVLRGATQGLSLGLDVQVWDQTGQRIRSEKGELVCVGQFPSMPIGFYGDDPLHTKFRRAYFDRFAGAWHHGDYVMENNAGGLVYFGRSDSVLNPGGVRIGTSEIYRQVERIAEVTESVVVGQDFEGDVRVVLFVKLREGIELTEPLRKKICAEIRTNASPFHVPKVIKQVSDIPRTRSGKIAEIAVRDTLAGKSIENTEALANPESLTQFKRAD